MAKTDRSEVGVPGQPSVWVVVATSQHGNKYIKTTADGEQPNNLLSLPARRGGISPEGAEIRLARPSQG
jgi:hypothetical protein